MLDVRLCLSEEPHFRPHGDLGRVAPECVPARVAAESVLKHEVALVEQLPTLGGVAHQPAEPLPCIGVVRPGDQIALEERHLPVVVLGVPSDVSVVQECAHLSADLPPMGEVDARSHDRDQDR